MSDESAEGETATGERGDPDTTRTTVRTYVPAYQRDEWDAHAEELGMSRSEFVKTMVQAGRRGFDEYAATDDGAAPPDDRDSREKLRSPDADPGGNGLEERVLDTLAAAEYLSWDELVAELTDDLEGRLEETLQGLQADDRVRYSGPNGGYTLDE